MNDHSTRKNIFRGSSKSSTAAAMEGKLKEKLESMGLAFLCLSTRSTRPCYHWGKIKECSCENNFDNFVILAGISGIVCFALTLRLAYASLMKKLEARKTQDVRPKLKIHFSEDLHPPASPIQKTIAVLDAYPPSSPHPVITTTIRQRASTMDSTGRKVKMIFFFVEFKST